MARSRNIKPAFFDNDLLGEIDPLGRLLFIGMWTIADYKGDFIWREKRIKAQLLPYDNCDIKKLAINLDKYGFIQFYSDGNEVYCTIVNFKIHQNPHKNEREKGSDIPEFTQEMRQVVDLKELAINLDKYDTTIDEIGTDPANSLKLIPDSGFPIITPPAKAVAIKQPSASLSKTDLVTIGFDEQLAEDYLTLRKAKKLPLTKTALINIVREGAECGLNPNQTLTYCINSNWAGFKKDWYLKDNAQGKKVSVISDFLKDTDFDF